MNIDNEVHEAKQRYDRYLKLESLMTEKVRQLNEQEDKVYKLYLQLQKENKDVEELEKTSFSTLFLKLAGQMAERKEKEEQEARIVELRYHDAKRVENEIREELNQLKEEQLTLKNARQEYLEALARKREQLSPEQLSKISDLQNKIDQAEYNIKEGKEAIEAGNYARDIALKVYNSFESASTWGVIDMVGVLDFVADMAKHAKVNEAKQLTNELEQALRRFKTELVDTRINVNLSVEINDFDRMVDFMFDNVFSDYMIQNKINRAKEQVGTVLNEIEYVLNELNETVNQSEKDIRQYKKMMLEYIEN